MEQKNTIQGGCSDKIVVDENYVQIPTTFLWILSCTSSLCRYHTLFSFNASESRSWKESCNRRSRWSRSYGSEDSQCIGSRSYCAQSLAEKQEESKKMGADKFYATSDPTTFENLQGYFDLMINTVSVS